MKFTSTLTFALALLLFTCTGLLAQTSSGMSGTQSSQNVLNALQNSSTNPLQADPLTLQNLRQELNRRGITENELRSRLIQRGIVLENIPPTELPRYQPIIMQVVEELTREKLREQGLDPNQSLFIFSESDEDELELDSLEGEAPDIFGHELFREGGLKDFIIQEDAEVPATYVLGQGDQIRITIFGVSQVDLLLQINEEGFVQPNQMPKIYLQGLKYEEARNLLRQRFSSFYTFERDQFAMTIQKPRNITIHILGEAMRKGSFSLSPFNSALNALYVAGGPDSIGTVRSIEVIRGEEKQTIDLYKLLTNPAGQYNFNLNHQDILFIPSAEIVVRAEGAVQRPMRYELLPGEGVDELITYAGGLKASAYPEFIQVERFEKGEIRYYDVPLTDSMNGAQGVAGSTSPFALQNGDIVRVRSAKRLFETRVTVLGAVYYPDNYGFTPGITVADLLQRAGGLLPSAAERAFLERRNPRDTTQVEFQTLLLGDSESMLIELQPYDKLSIYDQTDFTNLGEVAITGAVKKTIRLSYSSDLTVQDLFLASGGVQLGAAMNRVQVFRRMIYPDRQIELDELLIAVDSSYQVIEPAGFKLRPFDEIVVRQTPGFNLETAVEINGEVNYPGTYLLETRKTHLSELIQKAGGLRDQADPIGSVLYRTFGNRGYIVTNLSQALKNPRNEVYDPILLPGDVLTINRKENTVTLKGRGLRLRLAVEDTTTNDQLTVTYQGAKSARWYIMEYGGGFSKDADLNSVTVQLKNGQVLATRKRIFSRNYPNVEPGSTIQVDLKPLEVIEAEKEKFDWDQFYNRTLQTTTSVVTLLLLMRQL